MPTPSSLTLDLLHAIAERLSTEGPVEMGTMFRSPGLRTGTKILAFIGHDDRLIVKLPQPRAAALIADGCAEPVTMGTRTMREWVAIAVGPDCDVTLDSWTALATEALQYVRQPV
jgi:TfoX/Sxy family transcriptional regulator of competence genes